MLKSKLFKLTPEQRAERDAARLAWMEMTPQQKFEQRQKWHDEFLSKLPAEKREAIEKREAEARAKWASMSEEQKQDALKDMFRGPRGSFRGLHCMNARSTTRINNPANNQTAQ